MEKQYTTIWSRLTSEEAKTVYDIAQVSERSVAATVRYIVRRYAPVVLAEIEKQDGSLAETVPQAERSG